MIDANSVDSFVSNQLFQRLAPSALIRIIEISVMTGNEFPVPHGQELFWED